MDVTSSRPQSSETDHQALTHSYPTSYSTIDTFFLGVFIKVLPRDSDSPSSTVPNMREISSTLCFPLSRSHHLLPMVPPPPLRFTNPWKLVLHTMVDESKSTIRRAPVPMTRDDLVDHSNQTTGLEISAILRHQYCCSEGWIHSPDPRPLPKR